MCSLPGGLSDIGNLLRLIDAEPFHQGSVFKSAIQVPFHASVYSAAAAVAAMAARAAAGGGSDDEGDNAAITAAAAAAAAAGAGGSNGSNDSDDVIIIDNDDDKLPSLAARPTPSPAAAAAAAADGISGGCVGGVPDAVVAKVLGPRYGYREREGVRRVMALLQPLMWRTSKAVADEDHPLPPRWVVAALNLLVRLTKVLTQSLRPVGH